ncbi:MAG: hypothetical protein GF411_09490 [Candidatus Lokiarchaeota archaeon]|nr:hypothetical protein [Candidatus Lokiarchaeota archaeon]
MICSMKHKFLLVCTLGILLFITPLSFFGSQAISPITTTQQESTSYSLSYTSHDPIVITCEQDFIDLGFSGAGINGDPYIIQNLEITNDSICINITDTRVYFEILDCVISAPSSSSAHGIFLDNVTHATIENCVVTSHENGIHITEAEGTILNNNTCSQNGNNGIHIYSSDNSIVTNNTAYQNGVDGIYGQYSGFTQYVNNTAEDSTKNGFTIRSGYGSEIINNTVVDNSDIGIECKQSDYCVIENNTVLNNKYGIDFHGNDYCEIKGNTLSGQSVRAFHIEMISNSLFSNNTVLHSGDHGINLWYSVDVVFMNNLFRWNGDHGIFINNSTNVVVNTTISEFNYDGIYIDDNSYFTLVYLNDFGFNTRYNGYDDGVDSSFHNGSHGNRWSDYSGGGTYTVNGTADSVDLYPSSYVESTPTVDSPADFSYEFDTTDHSIVWNPADDYPDSYKIYRNGSEVVSSDWYGDAISYDVDGLSASVYNFTIKVLNVFNNYVTDTVIVTVTDSTDPVIDSPEDIVYESGSTGNSVTWYVRDGNHDAYVAYHNGTVFESGDWNGLDITLDVDGFDLGVHNLTLFVNDTVGNSVVDTVFVTVEDTTAPVLDSPVDYQYNEGTTGHNITWSANETNPEEYIVYRNGSVLTSPSWDGSDIVVHIDGLSYGVYNYTIKAIDTSGNSATDTVFITVNDVTDPTVNSPSDITYAEGETGNTIVWSPNELHKDTYQILQNGTEVSSDTWDSVNIVYDIDGLSKGVYNFTLVVFDDSGNSASDSVIVVVTETTASTSTTSTTTTTTTTTSVPPPGVNPLTIVGAGAAVGIVALVAIIFLLNKKK